MGVRSGLGGYLKYPTMWYQIFWAQVSINHGYLELQSNFLQLSFDLSEYTANVDGVGTLRLLDAIRTCGMAKEVKFYQVCMYVCMYVCPPPPPPPPSKHTHERGSGDY